MMARVRRPVQVAALLTGISLALLLVSASPSGADDPSPAPPAVGALATDETWVLDSFRVHFVACCGHGPKASATES